MPKGFSAGLVHRSNVTLDARRRLWQSCEQSEFKVDARGKWMTSRDYRVMFNGGGERFHAGFGVISPMTLWILISNAIAGSA